MTERLDKWLSSRTSKSRKDVKMLIKSGKVLVNGIRTKDESVHISDTDIVIMDGAEISSEKYIYIMMNKPKGVVSVSNAPGDKTVIDLLPLEFRRSGLFPAGRLDRDTTGFVLITDDGDFAHRILSPKKHVDKVYTATLRDPAEERYIEAFREGLILADGTRCLSAEIGFTENPLVVTVRLREGRYHQVKRMFASLGNAVVELHRDSIGNMLLDSSLAPGECRRLTKEEVSKIEMQCE